MKKGHSNNLLFIGKYSLWKDAPQKSDASYPSTEEEIDDL